MTKKNPDLGVEENDPLSDAILEEAARSDLTAEETLALFSRMTEDAGPKHFVHAFRRNAPRMLRRHRRDNAGFVRRNILRWRAAFDQVDALIVACRECGEAFNAEERPAAAERIDATFEALTHLHARAVVIAEEALCLMKGGYAEGALARWRALHECAIVAMFLAAQPEEVSVRYLLHFHCMAFKAARELKRHHKRARMEPFSETEFSVMKERAEQIEQEHGKEMSGPYGWAAKALGKASPNAFHLEEHLEMDHYRPYFSWASQHAHAGHRPATSVLGMTESQEYLLLTGPSNSGMVDPLQLVAIRLADITSTILTYIPNATRLVAAKALHEIAHEVGPLAQALEKATMTKHARGRAKARDADR